MKRGTISFNRHHVAISSGGTTSMGIRNVIGKPRAIMPALYGTNIFLGINHQQLRNLYKSCGLPAWRDNRSICTGQIVLWDTMPTTNLTLTNASQSDSTLVTMHFMLLDCIRFPFVSEARRSAYTFNSLVPYITTALAVFSAHLWLSMDFSSNYYSVSCILDRYCRK